MQTIVAVADDITGGDNPFIDERTNTDITLAKQGATEWWECINALGDTAYINSTIQTSNDNPSDPPNWTYTGLLDNAADPGVDDQAVVRIRGRFFNTSLPGEINQSVFVTLLINDIAFFGQWTGSSTGGAPDPDEQPLNPLWDEGNFNEVEIPLTEEQVQTLRDQGGFSEGALTVEIRTQLIRTFPTQPLDEGDYDISYFALELPGAAPDPDLELVQSGGYEISGSGADYTVQSGGYEVSGGGLYFINDIVQSGGYEISGGGVYGSNEIVQSGGYSVSGGGRNFYLVAPDISGIYVIVPNKRYDTWYDRSDPAPDSTVDVKIPDPFASLAFLPED